MKSNPLRPLFTPHLSTIHNHNTSPSSAALCFLHTSIFTLWPTHALEQTLLGLNFFFQLEAPPRWLASGQRGITEHPHGHTAFGTDDRARIFHAALTKTAEELGRIRLHSHDPGVTYAYAQKDSNTVAEGSRSPGVNNSELKPIRVWWVKAETENRGGKRVQIYMRDIPAICILALLGML